MSGRALRALGVVLGVAGAGGCSAILGITDVPPGADGGGAGTGGANGSGSISETSTGSATGSASTGSNAGPASGSLSSSGNGTSGSSSSGNNASGSSSSGSSVSGRGASGATVSSGSASVPTPCTLAPNSCADQKSCGLQTDNHSTDCAAPGSGMEGTSCAADTDCLGGLGCFGPSGGAICRQWCQVSPTATACNSGETCVAFSPAIVIDGITYGSCSVACTLAPNTCAAGNGCNPFTAAGGGVIGDCVVPGAALAGASCTADTDCAPGLGCFGPAGSARCTPWCQLSPTPTACTGRTTCSAVNPPEAIDGITYGACLLGGPPAFVGVWSGSTTETFTNCGSSGDDGVLMGASIVTFRTGGPGIIGLNGAGCTLDWTVSGNTATIVPGSTCSSTESNGTVNQLTFTSGTFVLGADGVTLTGTSAGSENVIVNGEIVDTCDETIDATETLE